MAESTKMACYALIVALLFMFRTVLVVSSSRVVAGKACRSQPAPTTLRSDQMTVIISGYSEHRIPLIHSIAAAYSTSPSVSAVILLWCNPSTSHQVLSDLTKNLSAAVLRAPSASLNHRFYPWNTIRTKAVLICDDDIEPDPSSVSFAFTLWRSDPDRVIGFFARSHAYDIASKTWIYTMEKQKYSIILTKFMILNRKYLVNYSCDEQYSMARKIVDDAKNCEDILMNFIVAEETQSGPLMVGVKGGGGVRDYGDARNDGVSSEGVKEAGLSSRYGEHRKRRGQCIREFHRVLGKMPLKYSYGKMVDDVGEQGLCQKGGKIVLCDQQDFRQQ
ncbi:glycosyltransferase family protein 64 C3 [Andrographis paniculata]|uniref:glycosyltransferase family protein 64 C3 n=1 Tax=Andrographis paniculata TaxID=175694 RepID=UPI0021E9083B|nr:glycosyltransferase family protein 64 C3 [Andrographis paniculata]